MVWDRKARLLLVSSPASPPSSIVSFQRATAYLIESTVSLLSSTTLPEVSTSLPPNDHRKGYHQPGASPKVWPAVCPIGRPLAFSFLPASRKVSQVSGNLSCPTSASHDLR